MLQILSKKLLLGICFFVLFISNSFGQVAGDFRSIATGNWNANTTWQIHDGTSFVAAGAGVFPTAASGTITIQSPNVVNIVAAVSNSASIVINSGGTLRVNTGFTLTNNLAGLITNNGTLNTLTTTGTIINNGTINNNLSITNSGIFTNNLAVNNATVATITQAGAGAFTNAAAGTITNIGTLIINSLRTITNNGILTNFGTITTTGTLIHGPGSFYKHSFAATVGVIPISTWNVTSTCEILACLGPSAGPSNIGQNFGHFIWNNTGQAAGDINFAGAFNGTKVGSDFTLKSTGAGRLVLKGTNAGGTTIGGNFSMSGGILVLTNGTVGFPDSNITLNITGSYSQSAGTCIVSENSGAGGTANGNGQISVGTTTTISGGTLTLTNSSNTTSAAGYGTLASTGNILINGGTVNMSTSSGSGSGGYGTITTSGTFTMSSGTLNTTSSTRTTGGNATITSTGLMTLSGGTLNGSTSTGALSAAIVIINANAGLTVNGATVNLTPGSVTGGGGSGTINVAGAMIFSSGTINVNSSTAVGTAGSNGSISVSSTCTISGTATLNMASGSTTGGGGNGTLTVTGAFLQSGGAINLCSSSGAGTFANGLLDLNGAATFNGGTINLTSATRTGGGGTGTINVAGNFSHDVTVAASFARTSAVATAIATINIDGNTLPQTIQSTNGFSGTLITFNISQGGLSTVRTTVPAAATFAVNSGTTFNVNHNALSVTYDLQVVATGILTVSGTMNVNADAILDLISYAITDATTGTGIFNLNADGVLMTRHAQGITTLASGATGCVRVTGARNYNAGASYTYYGTVAQVTGNGLPAALTAASVLTINNTSSLVTSGVTLTQATSTLGSLILTRGRLITTAANLMTIGAGGTSSPGSLTSATVGAFVNGPIQKIGNTAFVFPTGKVYIATGPVNTAKWARIEISAPTNLTDAFTAEYMKINDNCLTPVLTSTYGAGIDHVSYKEYWNLARAAGTSTPSVKLYWENNSSSASLGSAISSPIAADLHVAEFAPTQWNDRGATGITTAGITGTVTSNVATTFTGGTSNAFTFSGPTAVNPLPIELTTFTGYPTSDGNQLEWTTATETNNNYFDLERSNNGIEFTNISRQEGAGNSTSIKNYQYFDANRLNGINYYRLKQVDFDGNYTYSNIISIENEVSENTVINVYPNPSSDIVNIITSENISAISIYNMLGELVYSSNTNQQKIQFNPISKGIYLVKVISKEGKESSTRFVRQ